jgi:hypothetical protein
MFYDVKIMDARGKTTKIVSSQEISNSYWNAFQYEEANKTLNTSSRKQVPSWVKKRLDNEYSMPRDSYNSAA